MIAIVILLILVLSLFCFEVYDRNKMKTRIERKENFQRYFDKTFTKWWER